MAPLKKSYEKVFNTINLNEGRAGTAGRLRAEDFPSLFFSLEKFGVGNSPDYQPKPWPPVIAVKPDRLQLLMRGERDPQARQQDLFEMADQAFMFWKVGSGKGDTGVAQGLDNKEVRKLVVRFWKLEKAREGMEAQLRKLIATSLVPAAKKQNGAALRAEFRKQALARDQTPEVLPDVAPLRERTVKNESLGHEITYYQPYEVPHGKFLYPQEDTTKQILALREPQGPLTSGDGKIDALNKELFEETSATGRPLQVLTNSPKTVFYVVALVAPPQDRDFRFFDAYRKAVGMGQGQGAIPRDFLIEQAYQEMARDFHRALIGQLRELVHLRPASDEAKKQFPENK